MNPVVNTYFSGIGMLDIGLQNAGMTIGQAFISMSVIKEVMANVVCASCDWRGRRNTGQIVVCPKCGAVAGFE